MIEATYDLRVLSFPAREQWCFFDADGLDPPISTSGIILPSPCRRSSATNLTPTSCVWDPVAAPEAWRPFRYSPDLWEILGYAIETALILWRSARSASLGRVLGIGAAHGYRLRGAEPGWHVRGSVIVAVPRCISPGAPAPGRALAPLQNSVDARASSRPLRIFFRTITFPGICIKPAKNTRSIPDRASP